MTLFVLFILLWVFPVQAATLIDMVGYRYGGTGG
jgi:hypothetical protein